MESFLALMLLSAPLPFEAEHSPRPLISFVRHCRYSMVLPDSEEEVVLEEGPHERESNLFCRFGELHYSRGVLSYLKLRNFPEDRRFMRWKNQVSLVQISGGRKAEGKALAIPARGGTFLLWTQLTSPGELHFAILDTKGDGHLTEFTVQVFRITASEVSLVATNTTPDPDASEAFEKRQKDRFAGREPRSIEDYPAVPQSAVCRLGERPGIETQRDCAKLSEHWPPGDEARDDPAHFEIRTLDREAAPIQVAYRMVPTTSEEDPPSYSATPPFLICTKTCRRIRSVPKSKKLVSGPEATVWDFGSNFLLFGMLVDKNSGKVLLAPPGFDDDVWGVDVLKAPREAIETLTSLRTPN